MFIPQRLSRACTRDLIRLVQDGGSAAEAAEAYLNKCHDTLIRAATRQVVPPTEPLEDAAVAVARLAFSKAVRTFDVSSSSSFSMHCWRAVREALQETENECRLYEETLRRSVLNHMTAHQRRHNSSYLQFFNDAVQLRLH